MPRDLRTYLFDIAEASGLIEDFTRERTITDYEREPLLGSAVERQLEIVGEAGGEVIAIDRGASRLLEEQSNGGRQPRSPTRREVNGFSASGR